MQAMAQQYEMDYMNNSDNYGFTSVNNEITDVYSSNDNQNDGLLYKPGTNAQLANSLPFSSQKAMGGEYNTHNYDSIL
jgi:hypothetical protein